MRRAGRGQGKKPATVPGLFPSRALAPSKRVVAVLLIAHLLAVAGNAGADSHDANVDRVTIIVEPKSGASLDTVKSIQSSAPPWTKPVKVTPTRSNIA